MPGSREVSDPFNKTLGKSTEQATGSSGSTRTPVSRQRQYFEPGKKSKATAPSIGQANRRPSGVYGSPPKSKQRTPKKGRSAENVSPRYPQTEIPSASRQNPEAEEDDSTRKKLERQVEKEQKNNARFTDDQDMVVRLAHSRLGVRINAYDNFAKDMEKLFDNIKAYIDDIERNSHGDEY